VSSHYSGSVMLSDYDTGENLADAEVALTGYVEVITMTTAEGTSRTEGKTSWDGRLIGVSRGDMVRLMTRRLRAELSNGRDGLVTVRTPEGALHGSGAVPFP